MYQYEACYMHISICRSALRCYQKTRQNNNMKFSNIFTFLKCILNPTAHKKSTISLPIYISTQAKLIPTSRFTFSTAKLSDLSHTCLHTNKQQGNNYYLTLVLFFQIVV